MTSSNSTNLHIVEFEERPTPPQTPHTLYIGCGECGDGEAPGKLKSKSSGPPAAVPPVGGKPTHPRRVQALLAAGRLLQSKDWPGGKVRITRLAGESYPDAVARVIGELTPADRDKLRELVRWVMDYEYAER